MSCRMAVGAGRLPWAGLLHGFSLMARNANERHEYHGRPGREHGDGWGVVTARKGKSTYYRREVACWTDPGFSDLQGLDADVILLHARKASPGSAVKYEFTHPFQEDGWYFCHNGRVYDFEVGERNDSQQLLTLILDNAKRENAVTEAIRRTVESLNDYSALNFILLGEAHVYVLNLRGKRGDRTPEYFTMKYLQTDSYTIVSSEKLPDLDHAWQEMKNGTLLTLTLPDRKIDICELTI